MMSKWMRVMYSCAVAMFVLGVIELFLRLWLAAFFAFFSCAAFILSAITHKRSWSSNGR